MTFFLVPCLIADPVLATGLNPTRLADDSALASGPINFYTPKTIKDPQIFTENALAPTGVSQNVVSGTQEDGVFRFRHEAGNLQHGQEDMPRQSNGSNFTVRGIDITVLKDKKTDSDLYYSPLFNAIYINVAQFLINFRETAIQSLRAVIFPSEALRAAVGHELAHWTYNHMSLESQREVVSALRRDISPAQFESIYQIFKHQWQGHRAYGVKVDYFLIRSVQEAEKDLELSQIIKVDGEPLTEFSYKSVETLTLSSGEILNLHRIVDELLALHAEGTVADSYLVSELRKAGLGLSDLTSTQEKLESFGLWTADRSLISDVFSAIEHDGKIKALIQQADQENGAIREPPADSNEGHINVAKEFKGHLSDVAFCHSGEFVTGAVNDDRWIGTTGLVTCRAVALHNPMLKAGVIIHFNAETDVPGTFKVVEDTLKSKGWDLQKDNIQVRVRAGTVFEPETGITVTLHEQIDAELNKKPWKVIEYEKPIVMTSQDIQDQRWPSINFVMDTQTGELLNLSQTPPAELFDGAGEGGVAKLVRRKMKSLELPASKEVGIDNHVVADPAIRDGWTARANAMSNDKILPFFSENFEFIHNDKEPRSTHIKPLFVAKFIYDPGMPLGMNGSFVYDQHGNLVIITREQLFRLMEIGNGVFRVNRFEGRAEFDARHEWRESIWTKKLAEENKEQRKGWSPQDIQRRAHWITSAEQLFHFGRSRNGFFRFMRRELEAKSESELRALLEEDRSVQNQFVAEHDFDIEMRSPTFDTREELVQWRLSKLQAAEMEFRDHIRRLILLEQSTNQVVKIHAANTNQDTSPRTHEIAMNNIGIGDNTSVDASTLKRWKELAKKENVQKCVLPVSDHYEVFTVEAKFIHDPNMRKGMEGFFFRSKNGTLTIITRRPVFNGVKGKNVKLDDFPAFVVFHLWRESYWEQKLAPQKWISGWTPDEIRLRAHWLASAEQMLAFGGSLDFVRQALAKESNASRLRALQSEDRGEEVDFVAQYLDIDRLVDWGIGVADIILQLTDIQVSIQAFAEELLVSRGVSLNNRGGLTDVDENGKIIPAIPSPHSLDELDLDVRTFNDLQSAGIRTIEELEARQREDPNLNLASMKKKIGRTSISVIVEALSKFRGRNPVDTSIEPTAKEHASVVSVHWPQNPKDKFSGPSIRIALDVFQTLQHAAQAEFRRIGESGWLYSGAHDTERWLSQVLDRQKTSLALGSLEAFMTDAAPLESLLANILDNGSLRQAIGWSIQRINWRLRDQRIFNSRMQSRRLELHGA